MDEFKTELKDYIADVIVTINPEDIQKGYSFCDFDEDADLAERVGAYVEDSRDICVLNIKCFDPNQLSYGGGYVNFQRTHDFEDTDIVRDVIDIMEDFVNYFFYNNYSKENWEIEFESEWNQFVTSFDSPTCEVEFIAPLYGFWLNYGGLLEDTFNSNGVTLGWLGSQANYNLLKNSSKDVDNSQDELPRPLLSRKVTVDKAIGMAGVFNETSDLYKLNTLMLRTLFGCTAHIRFMTVKCLGNLSGYHTGMLQQYYPTFKMQHNRYATQIDHCHEQRKCFQYWYILSSKQYGDWVFADIKLLENAAPPRLDSMNKAYSDLMYVIAEEIDKTVNLVQVLESLIGEVGAKLGELVMEVAYTASERSRPYATNTKEVIERFVTLRNKYLHGSIIESTKTTDSLMRHIRAQYPRIEDMQKDHEIVERAVRRVLEVSFLNPDLKRYGIEHIIHTYPSKRSSLRHDSVLAFPNGRQMPSLTRI